MELLLIKLKRSRFYRFFRDLKELSLYDQKAVYIILFIVVFFVIVCTIMTINMNNELIKLERNYNNELNKKR